MKLLKALLCPSTIPIVATLLAWKCVPDGKLLPFFLSMEAGFLLASAIKPSEGVYNNFRQQIIWTFRESLKYTSPVSYDFRLYYLGLLCFVVAQLLGVFI